MSNGNGDNRQTLKRHGNWLHATCPLCAGTIHIDPNATRARRTCRACKSVTRWVYHRASEGGGTDDPNLQPWGFRIISRGPAYSQQRVDPEAIRTRLEEQFKVECAKLQGDMITKIKGEAMDAAREAAAKVSVKNITLIAPTKKDVGEIKGDRHYAYDETIETLSALNQAFLVGPAGSGKSTMCRAIADDLELEYGYLSCTEGLSEAHILGRMNAQGDYITSDFVRIFENGGVFLFDEADAMDANTSLVINEALANNIVSIPNRPKKPLAKRHAECIILCAANTYGTGSDMEYVGRNQLDAAFLDRFSGGIIEVGYDETRERAIAKTFEIVPLMQVIWKIRTNVIKARVRRPVTTRWIINLGKKHMIDKEKYTYRALLDSVVRGWSDNEKAKAFDGVDMDALDRGLATVEPQDAHVLSERVKCPKCDGRMISRIAHRGPRKGKTFFGCANYPRCDGTRDAHSEAK